MNNLPPVLMVLGVVAAAAVLLFAGEATEPYDNVIDPAFAPSLSCPAGWTDKSARDEHARIAACERQGWVVILHEDGTFSHAFALDTPGTEFVTDPAAVPGWR